MDQIERRGFCTLFSNIICSLKTEKLQDPESVKFNLDKESSICLRYSSCWHSIKPASEEKEIMVFYGHVATLEHHSVTLVCLLFFSSETLCCKIIEYQKLSVENYSSQEEESTLTGRLQ